ncbi:hypothetical protein IWQ49_002975 [Labrenzia sp. EL_126]|nr:hypothetical protein [Labrenzia sp. EL_126]
MICCAAACSGQKKSRVLKDPAVYFDSLKTVESPSRGEQLVWASLGGGRDTRVTNSDAYMRCTSCINKWQWCKSAMHLPQGYVLKDFGVQKVI